MPTHHFTVDEDSHHLRLDVYLTQQLTDVPSRTFVQKLIADKRVTVNDQITKPNHKVSIGDTVSVTYDGSDLPVEGPLEAENIPLNIFYEDDDLIVINKPSGLTVHPATGKATGTMANALLHHFATLSDRNGPDRPGIVHRLDRDTSGLIVVAKNNRVHARLARQFEKHTVVKRYVALVHGVVAFDEGKIDAPIGQHKKYFDQRQVTFDDAGKESVTYYRVLERFPETTLVALYPRTGRTHQLRVHMKHLGHPIWGDDKYGTRESAGRLALHAQAIAFHHPATQHLIEFSCTIPPEFRSPDFSSKSG